MSATRSQTPLELVPLGQMTAVLRAPHVVAGTPAGDRWIFEVERAWFAGDRLRGTVTGRANADWMVVGPDGTGSLDVRALMTSDDGALIFVRYTGRVDVSAGPGAPVYATPRFDTGDERYRWLNRVQAAAKGSFNGTTLTYDVYELR